MGMLLQSLYECLGVGGQNSHVAGRLQLLAHDWVIFQKTPCEAPLL